MADQNAGGLQKYVQDIMDRAGTQLPDLMNTRDEAQQGYLSQLQQPVDLGSRDVSKYAQMMQAFNSNGMTRPASGLAGALGAYGQGTSDQEKLMRARSDLAAQEAAKMASGNVNQAINELKVVPGLNRGANAGVVTKMDKDGNLVSYNPATGESKIVHSSQRGEYQRIWTKAYEKAVAEQMENPEQYAHGVAANVLGTSAPGTSTVGAPGSSLSVPASKVEISPAIQYEDKAEKERKKEFATGLEKGAIKDYEETVKPQAAVADSMLNTIGMLKQIPRTQDALAPWREKLGSAMNAVGMDGNMVNEAENLQQVRPLLAKIANDRLLAAKGVQTEGDAQRAYNEFLQITDTQKAADFMYAWTEELANRAKFKENVYRTFGKKEGTMQAGREVWESADYSKAAPVAILNGKPWTFTKWRDTFIKSNGLTQDNAGLVVDEWNKLVRGSK